MLENKSLILLELEDQKFYYILNIYSMRKKSFQIYNMNNHEGAKHSYAIIQD